MRRWGLVATALSALCLALGIWAGRRLLSGESGRPNDPAEGALTARATQSAAAGARPTQPTSAGARPTVSDVAMGLRLRAGQRAPGCQIIGVVTAWSRDPFQVMMEALESAASAEEALQALSAVPAVEPVAHASVTVRSGSRTWTARTDSRGRFLVAALPKGVYGIVAEAPGTKGEPQATGIRRTWVSGASDVTGVNLHVRPDAITVKGRVCDDAGQPVGGATVTGEKTWAADDQWRQTDALPEAISTVSDVDGLFELRGFAPPHVRSAIAYLQGSGLAGQGVGTALQLTVRAAGYEDGALVVPLVTEDLIGRARRFAQAMGRFQENPDAGEFPEGQVSRLPSSQGNTITDVKVILRRAGE